MISIKADDIIGIAESFVRRHGQIPLAVGALQKMERNEDGTTTVGLGLFGGESVAYTIIDADGSEVGYSIEPTETDE